MSSEWKTLLVSQLADRTPRSTASGPFGSNLVSNDYTPIGVPVIRGANMSSGRWVEGEFVWVSDEKADQLSSNQAFPGELVFTQRGTLGQVCIVPQGQYSKYVLSQSQMKLRVDPSVCDPIFMLYQFRTPEQQAYINRNAIRVGVPHTNLGILRQTPCQVPPLADQKAIAHILGTLDDKIELNRKTNETLEAMAKALFKSWFVDFDPVRAKAEGRPIGLPDEISALFPDSFVDSELGEIPRGWRVGRIRDLIDKAGMGPFGSRMKTETFQKHGVPIIKGGNLKGMLVEGNGPDFLSFEHAAELESSCVGAGDIVLTHRGTLGQVSMVPLGGRIDRYIVSQSQFYLRPVSVSAGIYMLFFFHSQDGRNRLLENASGVGVPSLARPSTLTPEIVVILPSPSLLDLFAAQMLPIQSSFSTRLEEQSSLASIRDALLPKLISGELRIPDTERMLEEVGV